MYSLFVSQSVSDRSEGAFSISQSRFLEFTDDAISDQLTTLANEAMECIRSWPCILMQEGRGEEEAHIRGITEIRVAGSDVAITIGSTPSRLVLLNDMLWRMREALDIGQFEFNRNHLAIKDRDLFAVLKAAGHSIDGNVVSRFDLNPLPAPRRWELIRARDVISRWGHTAIDGFLLEAGVTGLDAGRSRGNRPDRANAIVQFVLDNPSTTTAENLLFSAFVVQRAGAPYDEAETPAGPFGVGEVATERLPVGAPGVPETTSRSPNRVFVVHGQNEAARENVVSFLVANGLEGIVLHEQPNMGRHLLTKFIDEADLVTFAIVLMTDDDVGALKGSDVAPRARQNVILELGYFLSHLGQHRVCALITPGLETPSDFDGIVYISMDEDGRWETELKRELRAAEMPVPCKYSNDV